MEKIEVIETVINIIQGIIIIAATLFTSWWAYKTFAHKEKISELKKILSLVEEVMREGRDMSNSKMQDRERMLRCIDLPVILSSTILSSLYIKEKKRIEIYKLSSKFLEDYLFLIKKENKKRRHERLPQFQKNYDKISLKIYEISKKYI